MKPLRAMPAVTMADYEEAVRRRYGAAMANEIAGRARLCAWERESEACLAAQKRIASELARLRRVDTLEARMEWMAMQEQFDAELAKFRALQGDLLRDEEDS